MQADTNERAAVTMRQKYELKIQTQHGQLIKEKIINII